MNIFFLSLVAEQCAQFHCNTHVIKMILESVQLLYSAHHEIQMDDDWLEEVPDAQPYKKTHVNHPCSVWVRECQANYFFLAELALELCKEYQYRYCNTHKCQKHAEWLWDNPPPFDITKIFMPMTCPALACPDQFKKPSDPVETYRAYYKTDKARMLKYSRRKVPDFLQGVGVETPLSKAVQKRFDQQ